MRLEQLRPGQADQEQGNRAGDARHVVDQLEQALLRPVDVLEGDDEWPAARDSLHQLSHGPLRLLDRDGAAGESCSAGEPRGDQLRFLVRRAAVDQPRDRLLRRRARERSRDLGDRPVGDAVAVWEASPDRGRCLSAYVLQEGPDQPRLADSRRSHDGDEARLPPCHDLVERLAKPPELALPSHEGRAGSGRSGGSFGWHRAKAPRFDRQ